ncbi:hypothetical protein F0365_01145 [Nonlabens sp. Ci31]|uniref:hypothetical protein n=1 Tax=Nonlabens sp. Ci31 TaxID=2608253 RepID=UPI00146305B4|nr:hypothetical protein [Nonlabens sp. Ci31]QJP33114.1 hypothetical protein F0365_01145 [Nonlabens sp. Ci31]
MKKLLLSALVAVFAIGVSTAQDGQIAVGIKGAVPIGDAGDISDFGVGIEGAYLYPVGDQLTFGASVGFTNYFTKDVEFLGQEIEVDDVQFAPVKVMALYRLGDSGFGIGADVGYAIGINDGNDGGLIYEPKFIFDTDSILFTLGYQGISNDGNTFDSIQAGAAFKF